MILMATRYPNNNDPNLNQQDRLINPLGWVWTFGIGPRFILFGMPWQGDMAWQYNPVSKQMLQRDGILA